MTDVEVEEEDEVLDPRIEAGWQALDAGDLAAARAAAASCAGEEPLRMEALMLEAACQREAGEAEAALATLAQVAKGDPDWCDPELWMAEILFDGGEDLDEALRHARRALELAEEEDEYLAALGLKAAIELSLDRPTEARKTLKGLPPADTDLGDSGRAVELAQLLLEAGDPAEARARMETVLASQPNNADAWYMLGVTAEVVGDEARKKAAWVRTRELDLADDAREVRGSGKAGHPRAALSEATLVAIAEETLGELPEEIRAHLASVPMIVTELPAASDVAAGLDPRVLGLFNGPPHAEQGATGDLPDLTEIVLFRRNIERVAMTEDEVREEVQITLLHEAGHFFGLDEDALGRLDLD